MQHPGALYETVYKVSTKCKNITELSQLFNKKKQKNEREEGKRILLVAVAVTCIYFVVCY